MKTNPAALALSTVVDTLVGLGLLSANATHDEFERVVAKVEAGREVDAYILIQAMPLRAVLAAEAECGR